MYLPFLSCAPFSSEFFQLSLLIRLLPYFYPLFPYLHQNSPQISYLLPFVGYSLFSKRILFEKRTPHSPLSLSNRISLHIYLIHRYILTCHSCKRCFSTIWAVNVFFVFPSRINCSPKFIGIFFATILAGNLLHSHCLPSYFNLYLVLNM